MGGRWHTLLEFAGVGGPNLIRLRRGPRQYIADVVKGLSPEVSNLMSRVQIPSSALLNRLLTH